MQASPQQHWSLPAHQHMHVGPSAPSSTPSSAHPSLKQAVSTPQPSVRTELPQTVCQALRRVAACLNDLADKGQLPFESGEGAQQALQQFTLLNANEVGV